MPLKFTRLPSLFKNLECFGATKGGWTFVISEDKEHEAGIHRASVKPVEAVPFDDTRSDLGTFHTFSEAEQACNDFYRKRDN